MTRVALVHRIARVVSVACGRPGWSRRGTESNLDPVGEARGGCAALHLDVSTSFHLTPRYARSGAEAGKCSGYLAPEETALVCVRDADLPYLQDSAGYVNDPKATLCRQHSTTHFSRRALAVSVSWLLTQASTL